MTAACFFQLPDKLGEKSRGGRPVKYYFFSKPIPLLSIYLCHASNRPGHLMYADVQWGRKNEFALRFMYGCHEYHCPHLGAA